MGRPRKTDDNELVKIVEEFFSTEAAGNPARLKFSLLEKYAASRNVDVKAYDFRRSQAVKEKIVEIKELSENENGLGIIYGDSYKSLDIVNLLANRRDLNDLMRVLGDIDNYWKRVFESSSHISKANKKLLSENAGLRCRVVELENQVNKINTDQSESRSDYKNLVKENRYLRSVIKKYLYPALANEILVQEQVLSNPDTSVTDIAKQN